MVSLILVAALAASTDLCHAGIVGSVVKDDDLAEPFTLVTADGEKYRLLGQDFIDPRDWHSGDQLQICSLPGPGSHAKITDTSRSERLIGQLARDRRRGDVSRP